MSSDVVVFPHLEAVEDDLWKALVPDTLYVTPAWTQALARSRPDVPVVVVALRRPHGWDAAAAVFLYEGHEPSPTYDPVVRHDWGWDEQEKAAARSLPRAIIGTRNGHLGGILRRPDNDRSLQTSRLFEAVCEQFPLHVTSIPFLEPSLVPRSTPRGALRILADVGVYIPLADSAGLEGVLRRLSSNGRRQIRSDLRTLDDEPLVTIESLDQLEDHLPLLGVMLANVERRHGNPGNADALAGYVRSCAAAADVFRIYLSGPSDAPAAFSLLVVIGSEASLRVVGLDYDQMDALGKHHYHRTLVSVPLRDAARLGARRMDSGVGALDAKLQRGGVPVELTSLVHFPDECGLTVTVPHVANVRAELAASNRVLAAKWKKGDVIALDD
ncbi:hypothetical protein SSPO_000600 [Streptomyces antimycoticus]|uniref:BioF2-like acetyltransferase domain-containing protein n=1 Tax=Streptomyces antimycoticus TaxID=68175 RepID=A0A499UBG8_9ACTN|nr:hypothetical protein SSPO_000600 [Streptomyces antimycoticus]